MKAFEKWAGRSAHVIVSNGERSYQAMPVLEVNDSHMTIRDRDGKTFSFALSKVMVVRELNGQQEEGVEIKGTE